MSRVPVRALLALALVAATGVIAWRVLAPAEVHAVATDPYPLAVRRSAGVIGELTDPPLIVDGRMRVFAAARQVKADAPVDGKVEYTPRWSLRRWPQQLSGVAAAGTTVVTRWSDGRVIAIDARTGEIPWRHDGPPAAGFTDPATAVYEPPGLHVVGTTALVAGDGRVHALDLRTGELRWAAACGNDTFTTRGGQLICGDVVHDAATGTVRDDWPAGPYAALGCDPARSLCRGVRDAAGRGWQTVATDPRPARGLTKPGSQAQLDLALTTDAAGLTASAVGSGAEQWRWAAPEARVLGAGRATIVAVSGNRDLVVLDALTGDVLTQVPLTEKDPIERWHLAPGYVVLVHPGTVVLVAV